LQKPVIDVLAMIPQRNGRHHTWIAHVATLHPKPQVICSAAPLADDGEIGFTEGIIADQVCLGIGHRRQAFPLGAGQNATTRHASSCFL